MASEFIAVSGSATPYSIELRSFLQQLRQVTELSAELKARWDSMAMGGDFASLAAYLDVSEADATALYNLLGSVNGQINGAFVAQLLARAG